MSDLSLLLQTLPSSQLVIYVLNLVSQDYVPFLRQLLRVCTAIVYSELKCLNKGVNVRLFIQLDPVRL